MVDGSAARQQVRASVLCNNAPQAFKLYHEMEQHQAHPSPVPPTLGAPPAPHRMRERTESAGPMYVSHRGPDTRTQARPSLPLAERIAGAVGGPPTRDGSCDKHAHARTRAPPHGGTRTQVHARTATHAHAGLSARAPACLRTCAAVSGDVAAGKSTGRRTHPSEAAAEGALCAHAHVLCPSACACMRVRARVLVRARARARACVHACSCVREAWV